MPTFAQVQQQNARKIAQLAEPEMRALLKVLQEARTDTARGLSSWLRKIPKEKRDQKYTIHAHRALLGELDTALSRFRKRLGPAAARDLQAEAKGAMSVATQQLKKMIEAGQRKFKDSVQPLRLDLARQVIKTGNLLVDRHEKSAQRYAGRVGTAMRQELAVGLVRGESVYEIGRRLSGKLDRVYTKMDDADVGASYGDRSFFRSRSDAERLVRTEIIHAANAVQDDVLEGENDRAEREGDEDGGGWLKKWDASIDGQVCDECEEMDGEIVEAGELFSCGLEGPPLHPNCRCSTLPWRDTWESAA